MLGTHHANDTDMDVENTGLNMEEAEHIKVFVFLLFAFLIDIAGRKNGQSPHHMAWLLLQIYDLSVSSPRPLAFHTALLPYLIKDHECGSCSQKLPLFVLETSTSLVCLPL